MFYRVWALFFMDVSAKALKLAEQALFTMYDCSPKAYSILLYFTGVEWKLGNIDVLPEKAMWLDPNLLVNTLPIVRSLGTSFNVELVYLIPLILDLSPCIFAVNIETFSDEPWRQLVSQDYSRITDV